LVTIQLASAIVSQIGPCRIAVATPGIPSLPTELALLGCDVSGNAANAVVIEYSGARSQLAGLDAYRSANVLVIIPQGQTAASFEPALFAAGWRRHPGALGLQALAQRERGDLPQACFYQRAAPHYSGILNRSDTGSLGLTGRWAFASERVRAGDRVLLWGADAGEGRTILESLSRAGAVEVHGQSADDHDARSFDAVIALDAPGAWSTIIGACTRYLKLDGRLVLGWPDGSGDGPENWEALEETLGDDFLIESRFAQLPGQAVPQSVPLANIGYAAWRIVVATMNPIGGEAERDSYVHPAFGRSDAALVAFATGYDNPWLYRTMVQMGERLTDDAKLARLAEYVIVNARAGSADQGAALAVLGYRILENRADNVAPVLLDAMATYYDGGGDEPHVVRWRVSLAFLAGRLSELMGDREAAKLWYGRTASDDWKKFSNILATKAIGAAFFAGRLCLAEQDPDAAWPWFQRGVDIALEAAAADHLKELGSGEGLLPFYLPELAEVIDMGSQCANALANRPIWARDPGLFWRQVDVKRFGLASWAIDVARENARLRQMVGHA
jgi:hypothetical protein